MASGVADGRWAVRSWGSCEWEPDGFELAKWQAHPDYEIDGESTVIDLLAADTCGVVFERNHEVVVVVVGYSDESVTIEVWEALYPPPGSGDHTMGCLMGATVHLTVDLPAPLGSRSLLGAYPTLDGEMGE